MKPQINETPKFFSTQNYAMFEQHEYNRDVRKTKVLEMSMQKYGFDHGFPIRCIKSTNAGKLLITHGHHRFFVASKLGIPFWVIVAKNDIGLFESESSAHSWTINDFTSARARAGETPANAVMKYHQETGIPMGVCLSLVGGEGASSSNKQDDIKRGTYRVGDMKHANEIAYVVKYLLAAGFDFVQRRDFVTALSKCLLVPEFSAKDFLQRATTHRKHMEQKRSQDAYLELIEMIYNRGRGAKIPLAFMAREASRMRGGKFQKREKDKGCRNSDGRRVDFPLHST